ncbi:MAG: metal-dependent hydrolase, beta-lactamase superfamily [Ilumatobacteraceae bacterium]|nr:metal-dependent hydrolase, beta-lactamase superfamily [Ilumatobacteraceae bacterium]
MCGVRGSSPASGNEFTEIGGHTSCVAIAHDDGPWQLLLDGGTGLSVVSSLLRDEPFRGTIMLGHMHLDHTQGLPFFNAADRPDARVHVVVPAQMDVDAEHLLDRCFSPPHFPIRLRDLQGDWSFEGIAAGVHRFEGFTVTAADIPHGGGRTLGYRVSDGRSTIAYMSDHGPADVQAMAPALALADGVDALLHDSHFTPDEQQLYRSYGHSTPQMGVELAVSARVRRLVLTHHAPRRTDAGVHQMADQAIDQAAKVAADGGHAVEVIVGCEGLELQLP